MSKQPADETGQPAPVRAEPTAHSSSQPGADPEFAAQYGKWFTVVSVEERELGNSWPPGRYRILVLRPEQIGPVGIRYAFERRRPDGEVQRVEREFYIHVVLDTENRPLVIHHPYHIPIGRGDFVEIPIPLGDPWGELAELTWLTPADQPLYGPYEPEDRGCAWTQAPPEAAVHAPQLELQSVHCQAVLMRSLRTRQTLWGLFVARQTGRLATDMLEVIGEGDRIVPAMVRHETVISGGGSTSSMTAVDARAVIPMAIGDTVWLPLAVRVADR